MFLIELGLSDFICINSPWRHHRGRRGKKTNLLILSNSALDMWRPDVIIIVSSVASFCLAVFVTGIVLWLSLRHIVYQHSVENGTASELWGDVAEFAKVIVTY